MIMLAISFNVWHFYSTFGLIKPFRILIVRPRCARPYGELRFRTRPIVRPRADSRVRTNRSSAFASSLAEQARQPAVEPLNSPLASKSLNLDKIPPKMYS